MNVSKPSIQLSLTIFICAIIASSTNAFILIRAPGRYRRSPITIKSTTASLRLAESDDKILFDWEELAESVFSKDDRPVILFDGVCNLCNGAVNYALDHDSEGSFRFVSLQSKIGQSLLIRAGKKPDDHSSIVLVTPTSVFFKSEAVVRIARKLDYPTSLVGFVGPVFPRFLKNIVYDFVAENRYRFGEAEQCRLWDDNFDDRFIPDPE
mmetsp:Transcript_40711/g.49547  ORF Transcript_40711/g.49547 Transcript_40711/m.49547 type:complete len:209 (+) Transcript_40711:99-725(+)